MTAVIELTSRVYFYKHPLLWKNIPAGFVIGQMFANVRSMNKNIHHIVRVHIPCVKHILNIF